jgi:phosphoribosyl-AMP cyclohydrolase
MTEKPRTELLLDELHEIAKALHTTNAIRGQQLRSCATLLRADFAAKDRRIEELEGQLKQKITGYTEQIDMMLLDEEQADRKTAALQAQIDRVRELREAAGNLAWAAEVELDKSNRTREFVYQHREKVRHWIKTVRELLAALGEPAATPERKQKR